MHFYYLKFNDSLKNDYLRFVTINDIYTIVIPFTNP